MNKATRIGLFFGTTSGVITTVGLMVGLNSGTHSATAVLGGVFVIAIADSMSDSLGIHLSQESDANLTHRQVWTATISTFISKLITTLTFSIPVIIFSLQTAIYVSIAWGGCIIIMLSYFLAQYQKVKALPTIAEHLSIAAIVIIASHYVGVGVSHVLI